MVISLCSFGAQYGCHFTHCEEGAVCGSDERARENSCRAYCDRLVTCGNVAANDHDVCMVSCFDDYDLSPAETAGYCRCVARASCSEIDERHCPGAPPVSGGYTTGGYATTGGHMTGSSTGGGSTTSSTTTGPTTSSSTTSTNSTTSTTSSTTGGGAPGYDAGGAGGSPGSSDAGLPPCGH
jgi:hypothetical protein